MKKFEKHITIIISLLIIIVLVIIRIVTGNKYGISKLCSAIGGIWCYWPQWVVIIDILIFVVAIVLIYYVFRLIKANNFLKK